MLKCEEAITNALHAACFRLPSLSQAFAGFASKTEANAAVLASPRSISADYIGDNSDELKDEMLEEVEDLVQCCSTAGGGWGGGVAQPQALGPIAKDFIFLQVQQRLILSTLYSEHFVL